MRIFFDVDGVLVDGWHANSALRKPWYATLDADLGIDKIAFLNLFFGSPGAFHASPMADCSTGRRDLRDALANVLPSLGYQGRIDDFMRYWFEKDSNLNPDVFRIVEEIRQRSGARVYVATQQEHHRARYLWNELKFSQFFDGIFYSAEIGHLKEDVRFFEAINHLLGINAREQPLFFDDRIPVIEIARSVGWDATAFMSTKDIQEHPRLKHLWA